MADQRYIEILKLGVKVWNRWRQQHPEIKPDLSMADLDGVDLSRANLSWADLRWADLRGASLRDNELSEAELRGEGLSGADLRHAKLCNATLCNLILYGVDFRESDLSGANLKGADLTGAIVGSTIFGNLDFRRVKGLSQVDHRGPSTLGIETISRSKASIPDDFLQGVGVSTNFLNYIGSLRGHLVEYYTCFISYSSKDHDFAQRLYSDLQSKGVRCWFAPEHMKIGDEIRQRLGDCIRMHDKLLLVLSEHSIDSSWVRYEVEVAREKESKMGSNMLFPVRLDETVMESEVEWAIQIRKTRNIGDFTHWKDYDIYQQALNRLIRDLEADYSFQDSEEE